MAVSSPCLFELSERANTLIEGKEFVLVLLIFWTLNLSCCRAEHSGLLGLPAATGSIADELAVRGERDFLDRKSLARRLQASVVSGLERGI